jgi:sterol desaturase/sphingolipid hydroxylase (fatty acid hydroxylase superfamily)
MSVPDFSAVLAVPGLLVSYVTTIIYKTFLSPGGTFSLASLFCALVIATSYVLWRRGTTRKAVRLKVMVRALFPRRLFRSASSRLDIGLFLLNAFVFGLVFGWAIISYHFVSSSVNGWLVSHFGAMTPTTMSVVATTLILTVALFLAYEFGYWLDHYLCHTIPFLWEFHKVHHTAEVLSPLTNFRVHPMDTLVFVNILALVMGSTEGGLNYLFGTPVAPLTLWSNNIIVLAGTYLLDHLHHTHFWIAFTGVWGKLILSPAHHQIHHSMDPAHFNKNMGSCLGLFDWLFGTLHIPAKERENLRFGVEDPAVADHHTVSEALIMPVVRAFGHLRPLAVGIGRAAGALTRSRAPAAADRL